MKDCEHNQFTLIKLIYHYFLFRQKTHNLFYLYKNRVRTSQRKKVRFFIKEYLPYFNKKKKKSLFTYSEHYFTKNLVL